VTWALKRIQDIANDFVELENKYQLYIESDYNLYLDFIGPAYIWASGGSVHDVFRSTTMYDGNFVKAILRINNICENLMDICKNIERFDLCAKLECYNQVLIRDITMINSLYI
jgi:superfamily II RNA helicase